MLAWFTGLIVMLLAGALASGYLWLIRRRLDERAAGLKALSSMRWREFTQYVVQAMGARGLHAATTHADERRDPQSSAFVLEANDGKRWLLACKHGSSYRIGVAPVVELASSVRLSGAVGGILATEGQVEKEGYEAAQSNHVEVLDGRRLWPQLKPLLDPGLRQEIVGNASRRAARHIAIGWLAAFAAGVLVAVGISSLTPDPPSPASVPAAPRDAAPAPDATPNVPYVEPTEEELEQQRQSVSRALGALPGLSRGVWITKLTLSVNREIPEVQAWPLICEQVELYPDLRTVRVQLNPPEGSSDPVRWRQCKTY